jgi:hypothetical protein
MRYKPDFLNCEKTPREYVNMNLSFTHKVYWWIPHLKNDIYGIGNVNIPDNVLKDLKNNKAFLVLDHAQDSIKQDSLISLYLSKFTDLGIPSDRVIVLSPNPDFLFYQKGSPLDVVKNISKKPSSKKVFHIHFNKIWLNHYNRNFDFIKRMNNTKNINKHYLCLMHRDKFQRRFISYLIHKNNLYEKGIVSHKRVDWDNTKPFEIELFKSRPDFDEVAYNNYAFKKHNVDSANPKEDAISYESYQKHINEVSFEIVTESCVGDSLYITEKTFKPIIFGLPFLLLGNPYSLKYLKHLGFKTFDQVFDESYDSETVFYDRANILFENVKRMCSLSLQDCIKQLQVTEEICKFNQHHFLNNDWSFGLPNKIQEFIDRT